MVSPPPGAVSMPSFLWALLSLVAGWALYSLMEPDTAAAIAAEQVPECEADEPALAAAQAYLAGQEVNPAPTDTGPAPARASPSPAIRVLLLTLAVFGGFWLIVIAAVQDLKEASGFDVESYLATRRLPFVLAFLVIGFVASAYRARLAQVGAMVFNVVSKEDTLLWPLQAALAIGVFAAVLIAINPRLVDKLTTFKAGNFEADFAGGAAKLVGAPVQFLDVSRANSLVRWADFKIVDIDWRNPPSSYSTTPKTYRESIYRLSGADFGHAKWAELIIDHQLRPLLTVIKCFDDAEAIDQVRNDDELADYTESFANLIKRDLDETMDRATVADLLKKLHAKAESVTANLVNMYNEKTPFMTGAHAGCLKQKAIQDQIDTSGWDLDRFYDDVPGGSEKSNVKIWDLYVISALSDLISFNDDERTRSDFLEHVRGAGVDNFVECSSPCNLTLPSISNFYFYLDEAKVKSEATWPVDEMIADMRTAMSTVDSILASPSRLRALATASGGHDDEIVRVSDSYRKIKLQDLSLVLEIFYQRALAGEHFRDTDLAQWKSWLEETRQILSALDQAGVAPGLADPAEWRAAKATIEEDLSDTFDAVTSASLGLVLLPSQTGSPSSADCSAARGLVAYARAMTYSRKFIADVTPHVEDAATLRGLVMQIEHRIAAECGQ